jgi:hypothetical protein
LNTDHDRVLNTWGKGSAASRDVRVGEQPLEIRVSRLIGAMPILWLAIEDHPDPDNTRGFVERNSIALLSNYERWPLDPSSAGWLGRYSRSDRVKKSGLWNSNHVDEHHAPEFLDRFASIVDSCNPAR